VQEEAITEAVTSTVDAASAARASAKVATIAVGLNLTMVLDRRADGWEAGKDKARQGRWVVEIKGLVFRARGGVCVVLGRLARAIGSCCCCLGVSGAATSAKYVSTVSCASCFWLPHMCMQPTSITSRSMVYTYEFTMSSSFEFMLAQALAGVCVNVGASATDRLRVSGRCATRTHHPFCETC
jgi:hypothetical protein